MRVALGSIASGPDDSGIACREACEPTVAVLICRTGLPGKTLILCPVSSACTVVLIEDSLHHVLKDK